MTDNNIEIHYICAGRGHKDVYQKLLNNGGAGGKGKGE
jgi:hypothetical protein